MANNNRISNRIRGIRQIINPGYVLGRAGLTKGNAQMIRVTDLLMSSGSAAIIRRQQTDNTINGIPVTDTPAPTDQQVLTFQLSSGTFIYQTINANAQDAVAGILTDSTEIAWTYVSHTSISASLKPNSVVVARLHASASTVLFGRSTAGAGAGEEITIGANLTLAGGVLSASSGGAIEIEDEGIPLTAAATSIDFVGAGVTATTAGGGDITVTISGVPQGAAGGSLGGTYPNPTVVTNANLTGDITSIGNATTIGAGKVTEAMQVLADNTTDNVSSTKHGYAPKSPEDATKFLNGAATPTYAVPTNTDVPYAAGTWTPTIKLGGGNTGLTYSINHGIYTRFGKMVVLQGLILLTSKGSSTGSLTLEGLPFLTSGDANIRTTFVIVPSAVNALGLGASEMWTTNGQPSSSVMDVDFISGGNITAVVDTDITNTTQFRFSATYLTDAE